MRTVETVSAMALAALVANCAQPADKPTTEVEERSMPVAAASLTDATGNAVGDVKLSQEGEALSLTLELQGLPSGEKAFHLHGIGRCDAPDFTSAGGHLNPFGKSHGSHSENGKHLGDFPNITFPSEGTVQASFALEGDAADLIKVILDEDGTAVMIHEGPDDYKSDPAGAAGPRVACGVLTPIE